MKQPNSKIDCLPDLKRILIVGSGGRENALGWAMAKSEEIEAVFIAPGNGGTEDQKNCYRIKIAEENTNELIKECLSKEIDLVVIGPEGPLAKGISDCMRSHGLTVFGPGAAGSQLEASKEWAKCLMNEEGIPTAKSWTARTLEEALSILKEVNQPLVVKADGLAAGKGVSVNESIKATEQSIIESFGGKFGTAGQKLVLEEILKGPEVSIFALCDGENFIVLPQAQDHKRLLEGDKGPNTGGMGAYAPAQVLNKTDLNKINDNIIMPTIKGLKKRGINYRGVIYAGLMITDSGPKVIEFNCRFGDPECQALMPLLGTEIAKVLQACALGRLDLAPHLSIANQCSACVVGAASGYPESPRKGDEIKIKLQPNQFVQFFQAGTTINQEGLLVSSGGRVFSVVAQGSNFKEAFDKVYQVMQKIDFKGKQYRKDIGHQVRTIEFK